MKIFYIESHKQTSYFHEVYGIFFKKGWEDD